MELSYAIRLVLLTALVHNPVGLIETPNANMVYATVTTDTTWHILFLEYSSYSSTNSDVLYIFVAFDKLNYGIYGFNQFMSWIIFFFA